MLNEAHTSDENIAPAVQRGPPQRHTRELVTKANFLVRLVLQADAAVKTDGTEIFENFARHVVFLRLGRCRS